LEHEPHELAPTLLDGTPVYMSRYKKGDTPSSIEVQSGLVNARFPFGSSSLPNTNYLLRITFELGNGSTSTGGFDFIPTKVIMSFGYGSWTLYSATNSRYGIYDWKVSFDSSDGSIFGTVDIDLAGQYGVFSSVTYTVMAVRPN
jgi:hypothetical protein